MDSIIKNDLTCGYAGIYRGTVVYNIDPWVKGRLKIFVHGVYPQEYFYKYQYLPWAEPAMSLFGGNWTNESPDAYGNKLNREVGWCTVPHQGLKAATGSEVYIFFENNDINKPVYFAAVQAGKGWFSEHPNQHVFRSDNIQVRIDEDTTHQDSTCKFDTYNDKNNDFSIQDGTKKKVETRLDIQILAKDINAVNLQISGNVNMKIIGDWYVHHEGAKHETHIGPLYKKHIGNTFIEEQGSYMYFHTGKLHHECITADKDLYIQGNYIQNVSQNKRFEIQENYDTTVGAKYTRQIFGESEYTVVGNNTRKNLVDDKLLIGGNEEITIGKNVNAIIGNQGNGKPGNANITVAHDIMIQSVKGNIDINTLGEFDLLNSDAMITAEGYNNIGTKGNIRLISTLGNIAIKTINNPDMNPNLTEETYVIPWNPVFLNNIQTVSMLLKDFDPKKILFLNFKNTLNSLTSFSGLINFLTTLPTTIIYDGLPTFFPCRMVVQNPNKKPVSQIQWKTTQYKNFKSQEINWESISNQAYWKVVGRMIGNITIDAWSGDIDIKTHGRLGNSGNINIIATDEVGGLSTNKKGSGNLNLENHSKFRVYTDPVNMFLDSQSIFNRLSILSNGQGNPGIIAGAITVGNQKNTAGGCASCIGDAIVGLVKEMGMLSPILMPEYLININLHKINSLYSLTDVITDPKINIDLIDPNICGGENITFIINDLIKFLIKKYVNCGMPDIYGAPKFITDLKQEIRKSLQKNNIPKINISQTMRNINNLLPDIELESSDPISIAEATAKLPNILSNIPTAINSLSNLSSEIGKQEFGYTYGSALSFIYKSLKCNGLGHAISLNYTDIDFKKGYSKISIISDGTIEQSSKNDWLLTADSYFDNKFVLNVMVNPNYTWYPKNVLPVPYLTTEKQIYKLGQNITIQHGIPNQYYYNFNNNIMNKCIFIQNNTIYKCDTNNLTYNNKIIFNKKIGENVYTLNQNFNHNFAKENNLPISEMKTGINPYDNSSIINTINLVNNFNINSNQNNVIINNNITNTAGWAKIDNIPTITYSINDTYNYDINQPTNILKGWPLIGINSETNFKSKMNIIAPQGQAINSDQQITTNMGNALTQINPLSKINNNYFTYIYNNSINATSAINLNESCTENINHIETAKNITHTETGTITHTETGTITHTETGTITHTETGEITHKEIADDKKIIHEETAKEIQHTEKAEESINHKLESKNIIIEWLSEKLTEMKSKEINWTVSLLKFIKS